MPQNNRDTLLKRLLDPNSSLREDIGPSGTAFYDTMVNPAGLLPMLGNMGAGLTQAAVEPFQGASTQNIPENLLAASEGARGISEDALKTIMMNQQSMEMGQGPTPEMIEMGLMAAPASALRGAKALQGAWRSQMPTPPPRTPPPGMAKRTFDPAVAERQTSENMARRYKRMIMEAKDPVATINKISPDVLKDSYRKASQATGMKADGIDLDARTKRTLERLKKIPKDKITREAIESAFGLKGKTLGVGGAAATGADPLLQQLLGNPNAS